MVHELRVPWAKLDKADGELLGSHSLLSHSLDVAFTFQLLIRKTLIGKRFETLLGRELTDVDIDRLSVLAALHDAGKTNRGFQNRSNDNAKLTAGHVGPIINILEGPDELKFNILSALGVQDMVCWFEDDQLYDWLLATFAHHGRPVRPDPGTLRTEIWQSSDSYDPILALKSLTDSVRGHFPKAWEVGPPISSRPHLQHLFNGMLTLADWLGSDRRFFQFDEEGEIRGESAPDLAYTALKETGLASRLESNLSKSSSTIEAFAGFTPNPFQRTVETLSTNSAPSLVIAESDTGSGKTEAAFARFLSLYRAGEVDGVYFALPTRTAATQIHKRLLRDAQKAFDDNAPPVVLAVPGYITVDDKTAIRLPGFEVLWPDDANDAMRYRGWSGETSKRYMCGSIVVGTIDQALLSTLAVNHSHMRASALSRLLLVVDEVHASDAYMNRILEEVLEFHWKCGSHAFLMSATLGGEQRQKFLAENETRSLADSISMGYPLVSYRDASGLKEKSTDPSGYQKSVKIESLPAAADTQKLAEFAVRCADDNARVLIIRNTVKDCQDTLKALQGSAHCFEVAGKRVAHHSRFTANDRKLLDRAIEDAIGKQGAAEGIIIVATQTVEQSLDIDADILITDLAPVDVLLQRIGRLHRHPSRQRPIGYEEPKAVVLTQDEDLATYIQDSGRAIGPHGYGTVYEDLRILEATARLVQELGEWEIPEMNRTLVERGLHSEVFASLAQEDSRFEAHSRFIDGQNYAQRTIAQMGLVDRAKSYWECTFPEAIDERLSTRLGEEDRRVQFETPQQSPLGATFREIKIPGHWAKRLDSSGLRVISQGQSLRFEIGGQEFSYTHLGLERIERD